MYGERRTAGIVRSGDIAHGHAYLRAAARANPCMGIAFGLWIGHQSYTGFIKAIHRKSQCGSNIGVFGVLPRCLPRRAFEKRAFGCAVRPRMGWFGSCVGDLNRVGHCREGIYACYRAGGDMELCFTALGGGHECTVEAVIRQCPHGRRNKRHPSVQYTSTVLHQSRLARRLNHQLWLPCQDVLQTLPAPYAADRVTIRLQKRAQGLADGASTYDADARQCATLRPSYAARPRHRGH